MTLNKQTNFKPRIDKKKLAYQFNTSKQGWWSNLLVLKFTRGGESWERTPH